MSPGDDGAIEIQPPPEPAVNVFKKKDSPPRTLFATLFRKPPRPPPFPLIPVFMSRPIDCDTMAPGSTLMESPGFR